MQKLKYCTYLFLLILGVFACKDEPLPFDTFEDYAKGGFARLLDTDNGAFFFTNPDISTFTFDLEYYSENNGSEIASHEWFVYHRNNQTGDVSAPVLISSTPSSSFGTDPNSGLPSASFAFSLNEAFTSLGITLAGVNGGDDIIYDGYIVMNDGRRFGPDNTDGAIQGGAGFDGVFRFIKPLLCPSDLDGSYDAATTVLSTGSGIGWDACDGTTWTGSVRFEQEDVGVYRLYSTDPTIGVEFEDDPSFGAYYGCYESTDPSSLAAGTVRLVESCLILSWKGASQWGEIYSLNKVEVSGDGADLTIGWSNDYGEAGEVVLTRTDSSTWNPGLTCSGC
ncbi:MAG: hypothetical protein ACI9RM_002298 [Ulvibacter sp.]|jgi:hypothetical protein